MALYIIGDLHLALGCDKPMDIFPGWENYLARLEENWRATVAGEDTVVLAGDTSWAMELQNCAEDFAFLDALPGQKIILKGNHDYWWGTLSKMEAYVGGKGFSTLHFLHNNSYLAEGAAICGTRGWMTETDGAHDEKILAREVGRLRFSLEDAQKRLPGREKIAVLHYPPMNRNALSDVFLDVMREYGVKRCYYGHLHGYAIAGAFRQSAGGVRFSLISADAVGFCPQKIPVE